MNEIMCSWKCPSCGALRELYAGIDTSDKRFPYGYIICKEPCNSGYDIRPFSLTKDKNDFTIPDIGDPKE